MPSFLDIPKDYFLGTSVLGKTDASFLGIKFMQFLACLVPRHDKWDGPLITKHCPTEERGIVILRNEGKYKSPGP
jgi:hypothetical protein